MPGWSGLRDDQVLFDSAAHEKEFVVDIAHHGSAPLGRSSVEKFKNGAERCQVFCSHLKSAAFQAVSLRLHDLEILVSPRGTERLQPHGRVVEEQREQLRYHASIDIG